MFGGIPIDLLLDYGRQTGVMIQEELDLNLPIYVFVNPEYLTSSSVVLSTYNSKKEQMYGSVSSIDHPSFKATKDWLEKNGYIKVEQWWNGDTVLKPFYFNNILLEEGNRFPCASALGNVKKFKENYNEGKPINTL